MVRVLILSLVLAILIIVGAGYFLITSGAIPANADAQPGAFEQWAANTSLDATLKKEAPTKENPVAPSEANFKEGLQLYARNCAICHGGGNGGDSSASPIAKGEYPAPPQFATDGVEDDPDGYSFWKIKHGIRLTGMPSWKKSLNDNQIWTLALFLKHMNKLPPTLDKEWKALATPDVVPVANSQPVPSAAPANSTQ